MTTFLEEIENSITPETYTTTYMTIIDTIKNSISRKILVTHFATKNNNDFFCEIFNFDRHETELKTLQKAADDILTFLKIECDNQIEAVYTIEYFSFTGKILHNSESLLKNESSLESYIGKIHWLYTNLIKNNYILLIKIRPIINDKNDILLVKSSNAIDSFKGKVQYKTKKQDTYGTQKLPVIENFEFTNNKTSIARLW